MTSATVADSQQVFCGGVERFDEKTAIDDDDAGIQAFDDVSGPRRLAAATVALTVVGVFAA